MDNQLKEDYQRELKAPNEDSLTGLFNHGFFHIFLDREVKRSKRHGTPFTLALIDIDSFSLYNKLKGHLEGDRLLKEIATLIVQHIREVDLAARYSGDVFSVILINSDSPSATVPMERVRKAVEEKKGGTSTVSIGLASCPREATNSEELIMKANQALLRAKNKGKNRIGYEEREKPPMEAKKPSILIVDDDPRNLKLMEALLLPLNYEVIKASNGEQAISFVNKTDIDLVLLDIMMPEMDGYEVCRRLKRNEASRLIPVVMLTVLDDIGSKVRGIECGADDFLTKPPHKVELLTRVKSLINVKTLNSNLASIENVLFSLANVVEAKDNYTRGHVKRVADLSVLIAKRLGLPKEEVEAIRLGGILHDMGKIEIAAEILNKPGPLSPEEWERIKDHPDAGFKICYPLKKNLGKALEIIRHHHEKLDGSGYPNGLAGEEIPMVARIMAIADIYDALITDRPYRKAMSKEEALKILQKEASEGKLDERIIRYLEEVR